MSKLFEYLNLFCNSYFVFPRAAQSTKVNDTSAHTNTTTSLTRYVKFALPEFSLKYKKKKKVWEMIRQKVIILSVCYTQWTKHYANWLQMAAANISWCGSWQRLLSDLKTLLWRDNKDVFCGNTMWLDIFYEGVWFRKNWWAQHCGQYTLLVISSRSADYGQSLPSKTLSHQFLQNHTHP